MKRPRTAVTRLEGHTGARLLGRAEPCDSVPSHSEVAPTQAAAAANGTGPRAS